MRKTRLTGTHNDKDKSGREHNSSFHSFVSLSVCALTVIAVTGGCKLAGTEKHKVYPLQRTKAAACTVKMRIMTFRQGLRVWFPESMQRRQQVRP